MTLEDLFKDFTEKFPDLSVFYDHIEVDEGEELYPPIVLIHEVIGNSFFADNVTYWLSIENRIDVLTPDRDINLRKQIMEFLTNQGVAYTVSFDDFDESTMLFTDSYSLELE